MIISDSVIKIQSNYLSTPD